MVFARTKNKKRKLNKKLKIVLVLFSIISFIALINLYFVTYVNPVITSFCKVTVENLTVKAITSAVNEVIGGGSIYNELIEITLDDEKNVKSIVTNSVAINKLSHKLLEVGQSKLELIGETGVPIALGYFTGIPLFSGRGPNINIKVMPVGSLDIEFTSNFKSCGINQTNHQIILNLKSSVSLILPANNTTIETTTDVVVGESVIVGKIPNVYLNSNTVDNLLNLVP